MIESGKFFEYIVEILKIRNEEKEETTLWEFYLHKVFDKSYRDFKDSFIDINAEVPKEKIDNSINDSFRMLNSFKPE